MTIDIHIYHQGLVLLEAILTLIATIGTLACHDCRGEIETQLRTVAHLELIAVDSKFVECRKVGTLHHRCGLLATKAERGDIVSVVGVLVKLLCYLPVAGLADCTLEVTARKLIPQPHILACDSHRVCTSRIEHLDIVATLLLVVILEFGFILLNPRLKRALLNIVKTHCGLLDARHRHCSNGEQRSNTNKQSIHSISKVHYLTSTISMNHTTADFAGTMPT